jgi:hypothetical protein
VGVLGDYSEAFTVDGNYRAVYDLCLRYWQGLGYRLKDQVEHSFLAFDRGRLRKNLYTFSFEEAYKQVFISLVRGPGVPVTTVHICFSLPWLALRKNDIRTIRSMIKAFKEHIEVALGYQVQPSRGASP